MVTWIVVARGALFLLHGSSFFLCTVGNVLWTPVKSAEGAVREKAAERWGRWVVGLTAALMHLTVFSLGLLVIYIGLMLWGGYETIAGWVAILVLPMQSIVGILFWGLSWRDPWLLLPRANFGKGGEKFVRAITSMMPPSPEDTMSLFMWMLMQQQHTLASAHMWLEISARVVVPLPELPWQTEVVSFLAVGSVYLGINLAAWTVRGPDHPPYPIQLKVSKHGTLYAIMTFYLGCVLLGIATIAIRRLAPAMAPIAALAVTTALVHWPKAQALHVQQMIDQGCHKVDGITADGHQASEAGHDPCTLR